MISINISCLTGSTIQKPTFHYLKQNTVVYHEVIVIDGGSTDRHIPILEAKGYYLIPVPKGRARQ